jgi:hypothetical protein
MNARRSPVILVLVICAGILAGGCSVAAGPGEPVATSGPVSPSPSATGAASTPPTDDTTPEPTPIHAQPANPSSDRPLSPDPTLTPPPDGWLNVEGGDPVIGELGSWGWLNAGSDAPWLPGNPIHVGAGERLTFVMADPVGIANWQVSRVPPTSVPGGDGAIGMAEGADEPITFAAPPRGTWSVSVNVLFADSQGGAVYYWAMTVD